MNKRDSRYNTNIFSLLRLLSNSIFLYFAQIDHSRGEPIELTGTYLQ